MSSRSKYKRNELGETELNLVPMLDLFLSLIPFLLVSAAFLSYGGLKVETPSFAQNQPVQSEAMPQEAPLKIQEIELALRLDQGQIKFSAYDKGFKNKIAEVSGEFSVHDSAAIKTFLSELTKKYSKINSVLFHASVSSKYEEAVAAINYVRAAKVSQNVVLAVRGVE